MSVQLCGRKCCNVDTKAECESGQKECPAMLARGTLLSHALEDPALDFFPAMSLPWERNLQIQWRCPSGAGHSLPGHGLGNQRNLRILAWDLAHWIVRKVCLAREGRRLYFIVC